MCLYISVYINIYLCVCICVYIYIYQSHITNTISDYFLKGSILIFSVNNFSLPEFLLLLYPGKYSEGKMKLFRFAASCHGR